MEKYKPCLRSTNVTCPGALERSCSRALFLIPAIANTASLQYAYDKGNPSSVQRTNNGKSQTYDFTYDCFGNMLTWRKNGSRESAKAFRKMQEKVNEAILNYQNDSSNYYVRDTVEFTGDDGWNSYLAFGAVSYIITVRTETRTRGVWFWKHEQTRYVAEVMVSDFYNFDSKPWSGLGNILNNGAAILHCVGVGKDYYWEANYSYATKWERFS